MAFVYGSIARAQELDSSDIDLMVIGKATRFELAAVIREAQRQLDRPVNLNVYKQAKFVRKVADDNHCLRTVLENKKLFVVGSQDDLERVRTAATRRTRTNQQARAAWSS